MIKLPQSAFLTFPITCKLIFGIGINIRPLPVYGMYQPDAIHVIKVNGEEYLVTSNEGDSKDYSGYALNTVGFSEEIRAKDASFSGTYLIHVTIYLPDCSLRCKVTQFVFHLMKTFVKFVFLIFVTCFFSIIREFMRSYSLQRSFVCVYTTISLKFHICQGIPK